MEEKRRILKYLQRQNKDAKSEIARMAQEAMQKLGFLTEKDRKETPDPVRRCVASVVNKGEEGGKADPSDSAKSKAFAICWAQYNKGNLSKGFGGEKGKSRKGQYKAILKNKE